MGLQRILTGLCIIDSLIVNRQKTWAGVKKGALMFLRLLPTLMLMLVLVSLVLLYKIGKVSDVAAYLY